MRVRTSRLAMLAVVVAVLLGLLAPPFVNVNRYRNRVAASIGRALGRDVSVSSIELKLLPRPGLLLSNFVVGDDPSYGAEPMLRAPTVTALLRISSLWRGRLEIGTLDLDTPSLNVVRRPDGHWNLEDLVERTARVPTAPTSKMRPEARPRFPYVEATGGRINFKLGNVKKAFAFTDADFGLWLESENEWGVRLAGQPVRTDVSINDTGLIRMEGRFQRASSLQQTPLSMKLTYINGQLGQISKVIFAKDKGWRGSENLTATLVGTPASLNIAVDGQISDFRRYDIAATDSFRLRAHCTGTYSSLDDSFRDFQCQSPVGDGVLQLRGNVRGWFGETYDVGFSGDQIGMDRAIALVRHIKKDLPPDLTATGDISGAFAVRKLAGEQPAWSGGGTARQVALRSGVLKEDLEIGEVQFTIPENGATSTARHAVANSKKHPASNTGVQLLLKPFPLSLGTDSPATASAVFDSEQYSVKLNGGAELSRLLSIARALGVGTPGIGLAGDADIDLTVAGTWAGFAPPAPSGKVQLREVTAELQGISEPMHITSATATLANAVLNIGSFQAMFPKGPDVSGSANFPVHCTAPETCVVRFDVHTGDISLARLNQLVNPSFQTRPWYHLLAVWQQHDDALLKLRASGRFSATHLTLRSLVANNVSGNAEFDAGKLNISSLNADLLGGHQTGKWTADFTVSPPRFAGGGMVSRISMAQLSSLMQDTWATGNVDGPYGLELAGLDDATLRDSATGSADFTWSGGSLRHVTLEGRGAPMVFSSFTGKLTLQHGIFRLQDSRLQSGSAVYAVKGTASYDRNLDLRLERSGGRSYAISGPLDSPKVEPVATAATEALLR